MIFEGCRRWKLWYWRRLRRSPWQLCRLCPRQGDLPDSSSGQTGKKTKTNTKEGASEPHRSRRTSQDSEIGATALLKQVSCSCFGTLTSNSFFKEIILFEKTSAHSTILQVLWSFKPAWLSSLLLPATGKIAKPCSADISKIDSYQSLESGERRQKVLAVKLKGDKSFVYILFSVNMGSVWNEATQ